MSKAKDKVLKEATITIRLSPDDERYIEQVAGILSEQREDNVTKTWVVTQLMKLGKPLFEEKFNLKRKKLAGDKKAV